MKFSKKAFILAFITMGLVQLNAENIYNKYMKDENKAAVAQGKTVIINTTSWKTLCLESDNYAMNKLKTTVNTLKPVYVAEVIKTYPVAGNEDLIERFETSIMNVKSYIGIPYWSERNQKYYDLYSDANITGVTKNGNTTLTNADLVMEPFGLMKTLITTEKGQDYYYYESTNLETLRYLDKIDCVSKQHMKSAIIIFKNDDQWVLYGIGGVKAPNIAFLKDRIETSFMNRIKTFCSFFFEKL